jgi:hypothetical protein
MKTDGNSSITDPPARGGDVLSASDTGSQDYASANATANHLVGLNHGFQSAVLARVVLAGIGLAPALLLLDGLRNAAGERGATAAVDERRTTLTAAVGPKALS